MQRSTRGDFNSWSCLDCGYEGRQKGWGLEAAGIVGCYGAIFCIIAAVKGLLPVGQLEVMVYVLNGAGHATTCFRALLFLRA